MRRLPALTKNRTSSSHTVCLMRTRSEWRFPKSVQLPAQAWRQTEVVECSARTDHRRVRTRTSERAIRSRSNRAVSLREMSEMLPDTIAACRTRHRDIMTNTRAADHRRHAPTAADSAADLGQWESLDSHRARAVVLKASRDPAATRTTDLETDTEAIRWTKVFITLNRLED